MRFIDREKSLNPLYSKTTTILFENDKIATANNSLTSRFKENDTHILTSLNNSVDNSRRNNHNNTVNHGNSKSVSSIFIKQLDMSHLSRQNGIGHANSQSLIPSSKGIDISHINKVQEKTVKEKILENYYKNSVNSKIIKVFLRNASPYMSEEDKQHHEYKENKQRWISKDFVKYSAKKYQFIPNYINLDEFKNSPLNHKFREVDKKKWVASNFYL